MINEEGNNLENEGLNEESNTESSSNNASTIETRPDAATGFGFERQNSELIWVAQKVGEVRAELKKYIIGQTEMVDLLMTSIFANGHILLEGAPGVAKNFVRQSACKIFRR